MEEEPQEVRELRFTSSCDPSVFTNMQNRGRDSSAASRSYPRGESHEQGADFHASGQDVNMGGIDLANVRRSPHASSPFKLMHAHVFLQLSIATIPFLPVRPEFPLRRHRPSLLNSSASVLLQPLPFPPTITRFASGYESSENLLRFSERALETGEIVCESCSPSS